ncbi:MAG: acryloyl-CoA reductase [Actinobacteria bacterium]|nr:acryloyl-CoA reductase [Actinomycetota bacterium]
MPEQFAAFVATKDDDTVHREVRQWARDDLGDGDVIIRVAYSSVNYKDGLATIAKGQVARVSPLIPGIDLAGTVVESTSDEFTAGDHVLAHGYALGVAHHGGYAQFARVPADWVVPLDALSARDAMTIGTAGFTAAMSVQRIQDRGITPQDGPVLVTGASGGVGSVGVDLLAGQGYDVVASTGDTSAHDWLRERGASEIIDRLDTDDIRPLGKHRWAAAVDCLGGAPLAAILSTLSIGGIVAASGNTAGLSLETTVAPFILRGVTLAGIDSANLAIDERRALWARLADDLRPSVLEASDEVGLDQLEDTLDAILDARTRGRILVRLDHD